MDDHYLKLKQARPEDQEAMEIIKAKIRKIDTRWGSGAEESATLYSQLYDAALLTIEHLLDDLEAARMPVTSPGERPL